MSRWQRHASGRRSKQKLQAGLNEGSIVYGEIVATDSLGNERTTGARGKNETRSLRLAARGKLCFFPLAPSLDEAKGGRAGEVVRARLQKKGSVFYARVLESLGEFDGSASFLSALSLQQLFVETNFSTESLSEAASKETYVYAGEREDVRALDFVTIDGEQAHDFDDAVHAEHLDEGGWLVRVAIADVAHYVPVSSHLDSEARTRGNSRYLPDRVVPMLPPRLSQDLCSLRVNEERACVMAEMAVDEAGRLLRCRFARVAIRVSARLTYEEVQRILDRRRGGEAAGEAGENSAGDDDIERAVLRLYGAWRVLARGRSARGALEIAREEHVARLERDISDLSRQLSEGVLREGVLRCVGVFALRATEAHRLIEDMMILANVAVAERLTEAGIAFVSRAHEPPSLEKWQDLEKNLTALGIAPLLRGGGAVRRSNTAVEADSTEGRRSGLRAVLAGVASREEHVAFLASEAVLRTQSQARYAVGGRGSEDRGSEDRGSEGAHFALALPCYCHFTSPIRRYADLCVHRALLGLLGCEDVVSSTSSSLCEGLVANERSAVSLERIVFQRMVCSCLSAHEDKDDGVGGQIFEGVVVKVMGFGFFVRLTRWGVEGVVPRGAFVRYRYRRVREEAEVDEEGLRIAFGTRVSVRIQESDAVSGRLELRLAGVR